jgi:hypothetical protein
MHGAGTLGWPEHAPYDAILVSASGPGVPAQLKQQLAQRGRIVMPVGSDDDYSQYLIRETRESEDRFRREYLGQVRFVPLTARRAGRTICLCMTDMAFIRRQVVGKSITVEQTNYADPLTDYFSPYGNVRGDGGQNSQRSAET